MIIGRLQVPRQTLDKYVLGRVAYIFQGSMREKYMLLLMEFLEDVSDCMGLSEAR